MREKSSLSRRRFLAYLATSAAAARVSGARVNAATAGSIAEAGKTWASKGTMAARAAA